MSTVNVLRYSALGLGVLIGFKTDLGLKADALKQKEIDEKATKLKLIEEAKKEYALLNQKTKQPVVAKDAAPSKINWEDPELDYGSVLLKSIESIKE